MRRTVLTIAGSDSSGGAGIQADLKTMLANGVYGMSAVTALTAQNTTGVRDVMEVTPEFLRAQLEAVFEDIRPDAVKIGMVASPELIDVIVEVLADNGVKKLVVDPVMVATSGSRLMSDEALVLWKEKLFPMATVITPNIPEAEILVGHAIESPEAMEVAARALQESYNCSVLLKGGHYQNDANDYLAFPGGGRWIYGQRIENDNTHGTGCTLSSAIASHLALGKSLEESVVSAKEYISGALAAMLDLGKGSGPLDHGYRVPVEERKRPLMERLLEATREIWEGYHRHPFVRGLADGSLPKESFVKYMIQDYHYLKEYAKVFALGVTKARDAEEMRAFAASVHDILEGEMNLHRSYMERLGISVEEAEAVPVCLENQSYTAYMIQEAHEGSVADILATILSCAYSYEVIARRIVEEHPDALQHEFYGEWVECYSNEDYHQMNVGLIERLEAQTADFREEDLERLIRIFVRCSEFEAMFWDIGMKENNRI